MRGDFCFMAKVNIVLEGRFKGSGILMNKECVCVSGNNFTKSNISSYTIIDETNRDQYSFLKGALGVALLGNIGAVAGIGGKSKKEYLIVIEWKYNGLYNDNKSLILLDEKYYKVFIKSMF